VDSNSLEVQYCQEVVVRYAAWRDAYVPVPASLVEERILGAWPADEVSSNQSRLSPGWLTKSWTSGQVVPQVQNIPDVAEVGGKLPSFTIQGVPGAGKSVALMRLALQQALLVLDGLPSPQVPVLVPLRNYRPLSQPEKFLARHVAALAGDAAAVHRQLALSLHERLERGQLLLLLDGLDELPVKFLNWSLKRWQGFFAKYGSGGRGNRIIVTARNADLAYLSGLPIVSLRPLSHESKSLLLGQYLRAEDSANLWARLHEPSYRNILELTGNPFWLVCIAQLHAARKSLPATRSQILGEWLELARGQNGSGPVLDASHPTESLAEHAWFQTYLSASEINQSGGLTRAKSVLWRARDSLAPLKAGRLLRHNAFRPLPELLSSSRREEAFLLLEMATQPVEALRAVARVNPLLAAECALESNPEPVQDVWQEIVLALLDWVEDEKRGLRARILAGDLLGRMGDPRLAETVLVPAGEVRLGTGRSARTVSMPAFRLGKYPVTRQDFYRFVASGAYQQREWWTRAGWKWLQVTGRAEGDVPNEPPSHPVTGVTWYEAVAYGNWLSSQQGVLYRLPTEPEWERAARGQTDFLYPWGDQADPSRANTCTFDSLYVFGTTPVGIYPKGRGPYGAYDQAGNVWEWCSSQYLPYPYDPRDGREALQSDDARVLRGGSWLQPLDRARCNARSAEMPDSARLDVGFRLVQVIE